MACKTQEVHKDELVRMLICSAPDLPARVSRAGASKAKSKLLGSQIKKNTRTCWLTMSTEFRPSGGSTSGGHEGHILILKGYMPEHVASSLAQRGVSRIMTNIQGWKVGSSWTFSSSHYSWVSMENWCDKHSHHAPQAFSHVCVDVCDLGPVVSPPLWFVLGEWDKWETECCIGGDHALNNIITLGHVLLVGLEAMVSNSRRNHHRHQVCTRSTSQWCSLSETDKVSELKVASKAYYEHTETNAPWNVSNLFILHLHLERQYSNSGVEPDRNVLLIEAWWYPVVISTFMGNEIAVLTSV